MHSGVICDQFDRPTQENDDKTTAMGRMKTRDCCAIDTQEFSRSHYVIATSIIFAFCLTILYVAVIYVPVLLGHLLRLGIHVNNTSLEKKCLSILISSVALAISIKLIRGVHKEPPCPTAHFIAMSLIDVVCRHRMTGISESMAYEAVMHSSIKDASEEQKVRWKDALDMLRECEPRVAFDDSNICGLQTLYLTWRQVNTNGWEGSVTSNSKRVNGPPLSRCLKLRGIFCSSELDAKTIEKAFIDRIHPLFPLHFLPLASTRDGVVYIMMSSRKEAKKVMETCTASGLTVVL